VEYRRFIRKLDVPSGFAVPTTSTYDDIVATAISGADLHEDVKGINVSIELIRRTRGGGWPSEAVTEEFNFVDLVWHELEFRDGDSFAYAVYDATSGIPAITGPHRAGGRSARTGCRWRGPQRR
jgi:hypothetical protein